MHHQRSSTYLSEAVSLSHRKDAKGVPLRLPLPHELRDGLIELLMRLGRKGGMGKSRQILRMCQAIGDLKKHLVVLLS